MSGSPSPAALLEAAREGDRAACEQVLLENNGLIWSVARRYYGRGVEPDDLYQLGCLGFLKAVRGYDPAFGTQFSTYAVPKIAGEIRRFLRDDGPVKVSRGLKERGFAIRSSREKLAAALGREPTLSELAADTGLSPEDIAAAETAAEPVVSLQSESGENGLTLEGVLTAGNEEENVLDRLTLRARTGAAGPAPALLPGDDPGPDRPGGGGVPGPGLPAGTEGPGAAARRTGGIKKQERHRRPCFFMGCYISFTV